MSIVCICIPKSLRAIPQIKKIILLAILIYYKSLRKELSIKIGNLFI
jgi:hypothetical protein